MGTNQSGYVVQPVTDSNTLGVVQYCKDRNEFLFVKVVSLEAINVVEKWTRVTQNMHIGNTEKNYFLFNLSALYGLHLDTLHFTLNSCILYTQFDGIEWPEVAITYICCTWVVGNRFSS